MKKKTDKVKWTNRLTDREDAGCVGKFFVKTERWESDGTWYIVVFARKKSWIDHTDEGVVAFRDKAEAEQMASKLNETIGWNSEITYPDGTVLK